MSQRPAPAPPVSQLINERMSFAEFLKRYDGQHAEWLVDRVLIHMANNETHQELFMFLIEFLRGYLSLKPVGRLMVAPFSMYISATQPAREPDLMIILNQHRSRILPTSLHGPADIAIEIVSPESLERDYSDKFKEYEAAGVSQYWLFDPQRRIADIHVLDNDGRYERQPLDAQGRLWSALLPGFALDPVLLWAEPHLSGLALLRLVSQMTGVPLPE